MKPKPYTAPPWQLPHLLATPIGGTVLIVERCEPQPPEVARSVCNDPIANTWTWNLADEDGEGVGDCLLDVGAPFKCPFGPVGTVLACKERWAYLHRTSEPILDTFTYYADASAANLEFVSWRTARTMPKRACRLFFRTTGIDLKKTANMTPNDAMLWGGPRLWTPPTTLEKIRRLERHWEADNPGAAWGDWVWFITKERIERC